MSYQAGVALVFYRDGVVDTLASGSATSTAFTQPINQFFVSFGGNAALDETLAEFDILIGTAITATQATAIFNCQVTTNGAV